MKTSALIAVSSVIANACLTAFAFYSLSLDMWGLSLIAMLFILFVSGHAIEQIRKVK